MKCSKHILAVLLALLAASAVCAQTEADYSGVGLTSTSGVVRGISQCKSDLALSFAVSGIVQVTFVEEGQQVAKGDVLLQLDQAIEDIEMRRRHLIWENESEQMSATSRLRVAEAQWHSAQRIYDASNGISREELQNRKLAHEIASSEIDRLRTQKEMEQLDYLSAQENLNRRTLRAPTVGIVSEIIRETGESAQAYDPVLQLCDLSQIDFVANISLTLIETISVADVVKLSFAGHDEQLDAVVVYLSPVVDAASGLILLKAQISTSPAWLRPGLNGQLSVEPH